MFGRRNAAALVAEFLGTGVLTLLIFSVQRSTIGVPFFVAMAAGLAVVIMSFAVGKSSGGHFNPALTLAFWTARKISTLTAIMFIIVQFLGAWAAYGVYKYLTKGTLQDIGGDFTGRILLAEALGAGLFAFGFASTVYQRFSTAVSASVAGLSYTLGIIAASSASIALLNPSVAFGVRAWELGTYVLGPVLGAVIGVNLYALLFAPNESLVVETETAEKSAAAVAKPSTRRTAAAKAKKPVAKKATVATAAKPKAKTTRTRAKTAKK
jgi:aquaporin Z